MSKRSTRWAGFSRSEIETIAAALRGNKSGGRGQCDRELPLYKETLMELRDRDDGDCVVMLDGRPLNPAEPWKDAT